MNKILSFFLLCLLDQSLTLHAQQNLVVKPNSQHAQNNDFISYSFYDENGVKKFDLPTNHIPAIVPVLKKLKYLKDTHSQKINSQQTIIEGKELFFVEKSEKIIAVNPNLENNEEENPKVFEPYIINQKGEKIKEFKQFEFLSPGYEGKFFGYRRMKERDGYMLSFINNEGELMFGKREFWEATPYNNGLAIVQEADENDDWKIINLVGEEVINISKLHNKKFVKVFPFFKGQAIVLEEKSEEEIKHIFDLCCTGKKCQIEGDIDEENSYLPSLGQNFTSLNINSYFLNEKGLLKPLPLGRSILLELYDRSHDIAGRGFKIDGSFENKLLLAKSENRLVDSIIAQNNGYFILYEKNPNDILNPVIKVYDHKGKLKFPLENKKDLKFYSVNDRVINFYENFELLSYHPEKDIVLKDNFIFNSLIFKNEKYYSNIFDRLQVLDAHGKLVFEERGHDLSMGFLKKACDYRDIKQEVKNTSILSVECDTIDLNVLSGFQTLDKVTILNTKKIIGLKEFLKNNQALSSIAITTNIDNFDLGINIDEYPTLKIFVNGKSLTDPFNKLEAKFDSYLHELYPTCLNTNGQIDSLCKEIVNAKSLLVEGSALRDLNGLKYFKNLTSLTIKNYYGEIPYFPFSLKSLEIHNSKIVGKIHLSENLERLTIAESDSEENLFLPAKLAYFNLSNNLPLANLPENLDTLILSANLIVLPKLPSNLKYLDIRYNEFIKVSNLPNSLTDLYCDSESIESLPKNLKKLSCTSGDIKCDFPASLEWINVSDKTNFASTLPKNLKYLKYDNLEQPIDLPQGLEILEINNGHIGNNQVLPNCLKHLVITDNQIPLTLSKFPTQLQYLKLAGSDEISILDKLPKSLKCLDLSGCGLRKLNQLPPNIEYLNCSSNPLTELPTLPSTLDTLIINNCHLKKLPFLPLNLLYLDCSYNDSLLSIPSLPPSLKHLNAHTIGMSNLPSLPDSLIYLNVEINNLTQLPFLPKFLTTLFINRNQITQIPELPNTLKIFQANYNKIEKVEKLPASLTDIGLSNNYIETIPNLPAKLEFLDVSENQISYIPNMPPNLVRFSAGGNCLTALPSIPKSLTYVDISYNCFNNTFVFPSLKKGVSYHKNQVPFLKSRVDQASKNVSVFNFEGRTFIDVSRFDKGTKFQIFDSYNILILDKIKGNKNYLKFELTDFTEVKFFANSKEYILIKK